MREIPGLKTQKFYEKKWFGEAVVSGPPYLIFLIGGYVAYTDPTKKHLTGWYIVGGVWWFAAILVKIFQAHKEDKKIAQQNDHDGFLGAIHVLYGLISEKLQFREDAIKTRLLRITIYRVVPPPPGKESSEELEQIIPYVGGTGGNPGRKFSIRSGIIGRAAIMGTPLMVARASDNQTEIIKQMMAEFSFTEHEAKNLTLDRKAWMGVPIKSKDGRVVAVVYLDSSEREIFKNQNVYENIIQGCSGVAHFIDER